MPGTVDDFMKCFGGGGTIDDSEALAGRSRRNFWTKLTEKLLRERGSDGLLGLHVRDLFRHAGATQDDSGLLYADLRSRREVSNRFGFSKHRRRNWRCVVCR